MKSLIVIFVILILGIAFIAIWDFSGSKVIDDNNYNEIAWRLPENQEAEKVSSSFSNSAIALCAVYFIKKFAGEKYLIACEENGGEWSYYTVYAGQNKVYRTSEGLAADFLPPHLKREPSLNNIVKQSNSSKKNKNVPAANNSSAEAR